MKKLITLFLCAAVFTMAHAQQKSGSVLHRIRTVTAHLPATAYRGTAIIDTLLKPVSFGFISPCYSSIGVYATKGGDYLAGNNTYQDKEVLMRYALSSYNTLLPASIDTVKAIFGRRHISGNGNLRAKVYSSDIGGKPGIMLGVSNEIQVSAIDTAGGLTSFGFATPIPLIGDSFFVAVDFSSLYATGDSVALLSTDSNCATADTGRAWSRVSDGNYYPFADSANNWGASYDVAIFAHLSATAGPVVPTGISTASKNNFSAAVYPVPATNTITVSYIAPDNDNTIIILKDLAGKTVAAKTNQSVKGNNYKSSFEVGSLSRGLYLVELISGSKKSVLKLSIQ